MANTLAKVYTRLFRDDLKALKLFAAQSGYPWQVELRMLVRRALKERQLGIIELEPKKRRS